MKTNKIDLKQQPKSKRRSRRRLRDMHSFRRTIGLSKRRLRRLRGLSKSRQKGRKVSKWRRYKRRLIGRERRPNRL
jgi:hypothetical protein